jgi:hypothetical protein
MSYLTRIKQELSSTPKEQIAQPLKATWDSHLIWKRIHQREPVRIWSRVLDEWVLWVRDEEERANALRKYPGLGIYTLVELEHLIKTSSIEHLHAAHLAKKILGARITAVQRGASR